MMALLAFFVVWAFLPGTFCILKDYFFRWLRQ